MEKLQGHCLLNIENREQTLIGFISENGKITTIWYKLNIVPLIVYVGFLSIEG